MGAFKFVTSLSIRPRDLNTIVSYLCDICGNTTPLENVLVSPLFTHPRTLQMIKELKEQGIIKCLYFDSGGYQVQKGIIGYYSLYNKLLKFYRSNSWADYYILPDSPPVSSDNVKEIQEKVKLTVEGSRRFFWEMDADKRSKAIAVVQGREIEQIQYCLSEYKGIGIQYIGFGSFATCGTKSSVNILDETSISNLIFIKRKYPELKIHAFGVGNPPIAYILRKLNVYSFDSSGWMKTAAYGNIYFPFTRAYNVSYRRIEKGRGALNHEMFSMLKDVTGHECPFCKDLYNLSQTRDYRILHNLICMVDTVNNIDKNEYANYVISDWAPSYLKHIK